MPISDNLVDQLIESCSSSQKVPSAKVVCSGLDSFVLVQTRYDNTF
ncbi:Uncharacterised protein [Vibrio cholerae]|nr:Uncharacterised protein [Vibrio cholerae]